MVSVVDKLKIDNISLKHTMGLRHEIDAVERNIDAIDCSGITLPWGPKLARD